MIGDAIVWWRACVIWQHKAVNWAGPLLVTLTTGVFCFNPLCMFTSPSPDPLNVFGLVGLVQSRTTQSDTLFFNQLAGNPYSQASVISTVVTNALATSLIAYKAW